VPHLQRLRDTLHSYGARLREAVAAAVGETVAAVVRDTVRVVFAELPAWPTAPRRFPQPPGPSPPPWVEPEDLDEEPWFDDPESYPPAPAEDDPNTPLRRAAATPRASRWRRALAAGLDTALAWLRRRLGRYGVRTALAVGLLNGLATYTGGPLAATAVSLTGSALHLLSLAEAIDTGAEALAVCGRS
jgi:hypothetical protein